MRCRRKPFSITAKQIEETINLKDPEDAVKYLPSLFVRKRNDGDNQAVLATRTWGLNSSARTLIYYDDLLVSALIGNNNSGASPHWNLISPEAIARIDFLNGPFCGHLSGQLDRRRAADHLENAGPSRCATAKETVSVMPWNQYGTKDTYVTSVRPALSAGNRDGAAVMVGQRQLPGRLSAAVDLHDQWLDPGGNDRNVSGAEQAGRRRRRRRHRRARHIRSRRRRISRLAYDVTPLVQATYSLGDLEQRPDLQSADLSDVDGDRRCRRSAASPASRATNTLWDQTHMSNAVSLKSDTKGVYDFDLSASSYNYLQDIMLNPYTVTPTGRRLFAERQDHAQRRHQLAERRCQGHLAAVRL